MNKYGLNPDGTPMNPIQKGVEIVKEAIPVVRSSLNGAVQHLQTGKWPLQEGFEKINTALGGKP